MEWCDQKGEGHEYGSMQTGAIIFEKKIMTFNVFQSAWICEQGINSIHVKNIPIQGFV